MKPLTGKLVLGAWAVLLLMACGDADRNRATAMMNEGIARAEGRNFQAAVGRFEAAIRVDPDFGMPYHYLGMIRLTQLHDPEAAIPDLRRGADLMPDHAPTFYYLGAAHLELREYREAQAALERAVELDPSHMRALLRLGELREAQGQVMEAIDAYTLAIYADPRSAFGYSRLGSIYVRYEHAQEAIAVFREGWENSQDPSVANDLGAALLEQGQVEEAITVLREATRLEPGSVTFAYNLGLAYAQAFRASQVDGVGGNEEYREQARNILESARRRCGRLDSRARCNAIEWALSDLEPTQPPR